MAKYYLVLFIILGIVLYNIFITDPCNNLLRADFANKYPGYEILDSVSGEGSPETVQCTAYYEKPDSKDVYKDIWVYRNSSDGWKFSNILFTGRIDPETGQVEVTPEPASADPAPVEVDIEAEIEKLPLVQ
jgi:streptogramin lyase